MLLSRWAGVVVAASGCAHLGQAKQTTHGEFLHRLLYCRLRGCCALSR
jgi:hypothetical protein